MRHCGGTHAAARSTAAETRGETLSAEARVQAQFQAPRGRDQGQRSAGRRRRWAHGPPLRAATGGPGRREHNRGDGEGGLQVLMNDKAGLDQPREAGDRRSGPRNRPTDHTIRLPMRLALVLNPGIRAHADRRTGDRRHGGCQGSRQACRTSSYTQAKPARRGRAAAPRRQVARGYRGYVRLRQVDRVSGSQGRIAVAGCIKAGKSIQGCERRGLRDNGICRPDQCPSVDPSQSF